jgi:transketolase
MASPADPQPSEVRSHVSTLGSPPIDHPAGDPATVDQLYAAVEPDFAGWETAKDLIDELIDLALNYRQSGHPGGSRSKVHLLMATLLSGAMHWDLRRPWRPLQDRFVLSAGHTVPLVYATLALFNEVLRERHARDGDPRFAFPDDGRWSLTWEHLLQLRHRGGLPGHAEMAGRTLFLKFNTGPSGHGMPPAAGEALALKLAGAEEVKVFTVEGEGGLTPGAAHETKNTAWSLGLSNLIFLVDWNDYGIDERAASSVVHGGPEDWFVPYGWRVLGTREGMEFGPVTRVALEAARGPNPDRVPTAAWFRTQKGRGYGKADAKSHGTPWPMNAPEFWTVRKEFMARYGVEYAGVDEPAPEDPAARSAQAEHNLRTAISVLKRDPDLVDSLAERLVAAWDAVPEHVPGFYLGGRSLEIYSDPHIFDVSTYPPEIWKRPGEKVANRAALATWGAYVNSYAREAYGRPLVIACSADLAESTNIAGFAKGFGDREGWGWYERDSNPRGALLPTEITEFTNAGMMAGLASVNLAPDPFGTFDGFWGACSTYGSFSYLKYGAMRLFSQLAQDCELRVGKVIWVAGHSGPETAEDSRTHFGIYGPGMTQLFPAGHVIDLHPWEYNEVPVLLAAALSSDVPIVALHLVRPAVEVPDRAALGMDSHLDAARGAYVLRPYRSDAPRGGMIVVRGSKSTANLVQLFPELDRRGLNVKVVASVSPQLFERQDAAWQERVAAPADRWDAMCISNASLRFMAEWLTHPLVGEYSLSADWDGRWRTGGTVDEVYDEAHLSSAHMLAGIERFVADREARLTRLRETVASL